MNTFKTAVTLSYNQARHIVTTLYTAHYDCNGDPSSKNATELEKNRELLIQLLMLPIGSTVEVTTKYGSGKAIGSTHFSFKSKLKMSSYRDGTDIHKDIAYAFLHARNFGHLKNKLFQRYHYTLGKPLVQNQEPDSTYEIDSRDWVWMDAVPHNRY